MDIFDLIQRGGAITSDDLVTKAEDLIPNYKEIPKRPNPKKDSKSLKEASSIGKGGFTVVGEKDECNSDCTKTTGDKKMSQKGIDFLKGYESEVKKNGKHVLYNDDSGYCTIGYGHLVDGKKPCSKINKIFKQEYKKGLSDKDAEDLFKKDLEEREKAVNKLVKKPICQQEFDAMMSLMYNVGVGNLMISNVLKYTNQGKSKEAKKGFKSFEKSNGKRLNGLVKRRKAESNMYECGVYDSSH